jgi:ethanolamine utilization protein EutN
VFLARVVGTVVATRKDPASVGTKLLVIQPIKNDGTASGKTLVAVDSVGAGVTEDVFYVRGREASVPSCPTRSRPTPPSSASSTTGPS